MNISIEDRQETYRFIYSINQYQYVTRSNGSSLLHLSVNDNTSAEDYFIDRTCKYDILTRENPTYSLSFSDIHVRSPFVH